MKKIVLLSLVMLISAVSVFALSYDVVTVSPQTIRVAMDSDVYGTTWGQCIAVCTGQCLENKEGSREECEKMCTDKCHPQPDVITKPRIEKPIAPIVVDCASGCKQNFLQCQQGIMGQVDCRVLYAECLKKCAP